MRVGECTKGCGACCRFLTLQVNPQYYDNADVRRWIELHRIRLVQRDGATWAYIPTECSQLTAEGDCAIHDTRPQVCNDWPQLPEQIVELETVAGAVCTYRFEEVTSNGRPTI